MMTEKDQEIQLLRQREKAHLKEITYLRDLLYRLREGLLHRRKFAYLKLVLCTFQCFNSLFSLSWLQRAASRVILRVNFT